MYLGVRTAGIHTTIATQKDYTKQKIIKQKIIINNRHTMIIKQ